jgi:RHS repeat-associated protein
VQVNASVTAGITYAIDGMNHRIGKLITPSMGSSVGEGLLYDEQGRVVAELDGGGSVLSTFVYGLKPNVPDYMLRGGVAYRIVSDWRGDVRVVLDTTKTGAAAVVEQIDYDEWGHVANLVDPSCSQGGTALCWQPFGFAGGVYDVTTGIVRFGARDYDPTMRRWTQKDPRSIGGGQSNVYVYVGDDPINATDSSGKDAYTWCLAVCGAGYLACLGTGAPAGICADLWEYCSLGCEAKYPPGPPTPNTNPCDGGGSDW